MIRLASRTSLSLLYALALGGVAIIAVVLPVYLSAVYHLSWLRALAVTCVVVGLSGAARLAGGWWTDLRPTTGLLTVCYAIAAVLCVVAATVPGHIWLTVPVVAAIGICDGAAGGALLALIGKATRAECAGAVMGVTGAAAALGTLPSVLLTLAGGSRHWYTAEWLLLAGSLIAAAVYVRGHGLTVGLGLAVRVEPEPGPVATTVAVVGGSPERFGLPALVARLAELAVSDELIVVYGSDEPLHHRRHAHVLVAGLRNRLPRYRIVAVRTVPRSGTIGHVTAVLGELVETGAVTIAVTPTAQLPAVTAELSHSLRADRVLRLSYTLASGAGLQEVWSRASTTATGGLRAVESLN
jgi:hypothetical protein